MLLEGIVLIGSLAALGILESHVEWCIQQAKKHATTVH
jgi:hypothetical protein